MASINRRRFLKAAARQAPARPRTAVAAPAIAQSAPEIQWRMPVSWPKTLDTLYGGAEQFCKYVSEATDGKFQIRPMLGDEKIPALEVTEAVANGTVEACHTAPYYMFAKDPTFAFGCAVPFGLNGRMQNAWWLEGGGEAPDERLLRQVQHLRPAGRQHHGPDGRLVPQGDQHHRRPQGRQDAHRRLCRRGDLQARRRAAAACRRRHLSGAGEGHGRCRRVGRPPRRREARPAQGREVLLLPRLVGRRRHAARADQQGEVGGAAQGLPGDPAGRPRRRPTTSWSAATTR